MEKYIKEFREVFRKARTLIWFSIGVLFIPLTSMSIIAYILLAGVEVNQLVLQILFLISITSNAVLFFTLFVWILFYLKEPPEPKKDPDPIRLLIGAGHQSDVLGEIYETSYLHNNKTQNKSNKTVSMEYLMQLQEEILRRFVRTYALKPIGNPGEGPIEYNPTKHRANQKIERGTAVFILSIGWEKEGKTILPALVSTKTDKW